MLNHASLLRNTLLAVTAVLCGTTLGHAQALFNVDLNTPTSPTQSGAAAIGSPGDIWNGLTSGASTSLVKASGESSSVSFSFVNPFSWNVDNAGGTAIDANTAALMQDYIYSQNTSAITASFTGLTDYIGSAFTLYIYSAGDNNSFGGQGSTITVGATTLQTSGDDRKISSGVGVAYQVFTGTISSDSLDFSLVQNTNQYFAFNGAQLQVVPEPGTYALLGVGLLVIAVGTYRSRQRTS